jgi:hypothetical protein
LAETLDGSYLPAQKYLEASLASVTTAQYSRVASTAGFAGGLISNWLLPHVANAQNRDIPNQVWAHEFVLADKDGTALEVIGIERDGLPSMEFLKRDGRVRTVRSNDGFSSISVGGGPRQKQLDHFDIG